jgi:thymidylate kinase
MTMAERTSSSVTDATGTLLAHQELTHSAFTALRQPEPWHGAAEAVLQPDALLARLAEALEQGRVRYCQWKGHARLARLAAGEGDLDLLVDRRHAGALSAMLDLLGFRLALPPGARQVPGVLSYLGVDPACDRLLHVHVHHQLIVGRTWSRYYRLPVEQPVLDSSMTRTYFRTPSPEFELLLYVLRRTLQHHPLDALRTREPQWLRSAALELELLEDEAEQSALIQLLDLHLPEIDRGCFERCHASLRPGSSPGIRLLARMELERSLRGHRRSRGAGAVLAAVGRRIRGSMQPRRDAGAGKRLASGGAVIALVGADGSGKSTCARALHQFLATELDVLHAHLGRPPRSLFTLAVGGALRAARRVDARRKTERPSRATSHLELMRYVCTARDRLRLQQRVQRRATLGGVVLCERYPVPQNQALAGPSTAQGEALTARTRFAATLRRRELDYYDRMTRPDLLVVLRVDPDTAVWRKPEEPADYVRRRATIVWETEWPERQTIVVDAGRPLPDVLTELRSRIWEAL